MKKVVIRNDEHKAKQIREEINQGVKTLEHYLDLGATITENKQISFDINVINNHLQSTFERKINPQVAADLFSVGPQYMDLKNGQSFIKDNIKFYDIDPKANKGKRVKINSEVVKVHIEAITVSYLDDKYLDHYNDLKNVAMQIDEYSSKYGLIFYNNSIEKYARSGETPAGATGIRVSPKIFNTTIQRMLAGGVKF